VTPPAEPIFHTISSTTSLVNTAFSPLVMHLPATPPENVYTDVTSTVVSEKFYKAEME